MEKNTISINNVYPVMLDKSSDILWVIYWLYQYWLFIDYLT